MGESLYHIYMMLTFSSKSRTLARKSVTDNARSIFDSTPRTLLLYSHEAFDVREVPSSSFEVVDRPFEYFPFAVWLGREFLQQRDQRLVVF